MKDNQFLAILNSSDSKLTLINCSFTNNWFLKNDFPIFLINGNAQASQNFSSFIFTGNSIYSEVIHITGNNKNTSFSSFRFNNNSGCGTFIWITQTQNSSIILENAFEFYNNSCKSLSLNLLINLLDNDNSLFVNLSDISFSRFDFSASMTFDQNFANSDFFLLNNILSLEAMLFKNFLIFTNNIIINGFFFNLI